VWDAAAKYGRPQLTAITTMFCDVPQRKSMNERFGLKTEAGYGIAYRPNGEDQVNSIMRFIRSSLGSF